MNDLLYTLITLAIIGAMAIGGMLLLQVAAWGWYRHDGGRLGLVAWLRGI